MKRRFIVVLYTVLALAFGLGAASAEPISPWWVNDGYGAGMVPPSFPVVSPLIPPALLPYIPPAALPLVSPTIPLLNPVGGAFYPNYSTGTIYPFPFSGFPPVYVPGYFPTHPVYPEYPVHRAYPVHPMHPMHPVHPVHPIHPGYHGYHGHPGHEAHTGYGRATYMGHFGRGHAGRGGHGRH